MIKNREVIEKIEFPVKKPYTLREKALAHDILSTLSTFNSVVSAENGNDKITREQLKEFITARWNDLDINVMNLGIEKEEDGKTYMSLLGKYVT